MNAPYQFPFGAPLTPTRPSAGTARRAFVLGAYPSALHVRWVSPDGLHSIATLPVDNEPEPFWTGTDQEQRISEWASSVDLDLEVDGTVRSVGSFNGSSGIALDRDYLIPLSIERSEAWVTDCLNTYRMSPGVAKAIENHFDPAMRQLHNRLPRLPEHPSESAIVREATEPARLKQLQAEFKTATPGVVITLGNAAARVLQAMLDIASGPVPLEKSGYGEVFELAGGQQWYPLAHPGATRKGRGWHEVHADWTQ